MNILILANKVPFPPKDGGAFATLNMTLGLSEAGARVTLLAMSTPKHTTTQNDFPDWLLNKIDVKTVYVNTVISPFSALYNLFFSSYPYNAKRFISKTFNDLLTTTLRKKTFDIVQLEGLYLEHYITTIRKYHEGPISLRAHNVEWEIWARNAILQKNPITKYYFSNLAKRIKNLEKEVLQKVDILVPISYRDSKMLHLLGYNGDIYNCPTGYSIQQNIEVKENFEFPSVFHLGGLDWIPNQEGIIWFMDKAWPIIRDSVPTAKFFIAGRNAPKTFIQKVKSYAGVVFCGEVENSEDFIRSKAVMVVPLLSGSGMRIKIVEGMALGKAIVSTRIGAEGIEAKDGIHFSIADSSALFAQKVIELLQSKKKILNMGKNAIEFAKKNLDNNQLTLNLFSFYQNFQYKKDE